MSIVKKVRKKMEEYGIKIFDDYQIQDEDEHVFYIEDMILFANTKEDSIGISLQATTKPFKAATLALIVNEIKCKDLHVMEDFIFNEKNQYVSGDEAHKLIKRSDATKIANELSKSEVYTKILQNSKCHEC